MKIIFGSDEKTSLTDFITGWLKKVNHSVEKIGHLAREDKKWKWVDIGKEVALSTSGVESGVGKP